MVLHFIRLLQGPPWRGRERRDFPESSSPRSLQQQHANPCNKKDTGEAEGGAMATVGDLWRKTMSATVCQTISGWNRINQNQGPSFCRLRLIDFDLRSLWSLPPKNGHLLEVRRCLVLRAEKRRTTSLSRNNESRNVQVTPYCHFKDAKPGLSKFLN